MKMFEKYINSELNVLEFPGFGVFSEFKIRVPRILKPFLRKEIKKEESQFTSIKEQIEAELIVYGEIQ